MSNDYVHVVVACDGENVKLFINGEYVTSVQAGDSKTIEYWAVPDE